MSLLISTTLVHAADALADLGRTAFSDPRLSADHQVSCATCHRPDKAFQDGRPTARGAFGQPGTRNTPSLLRVSQQRELFWDGRRDSLQSQAFDPLLNPREHGMADAKAVLAVIEAAPEYGPLFDAANAALAPEERRKGPRINEPTLRAALTAFEAQLVDGESPFEVFRYRGDAQAISASAKAGWALFSGRAQCTACHHVQDRAPVSFTDQAYHAFDSPSRVGGQALADLVTRFMTARDQGASIDQILLSDAKMAELGRFVVTLSPADIGKFRTPSLRNVALTAPYMHDGSVATLAEAVDLEIYYRGTQDGHPLILTAQEKQDVVDFLSALTAVPPAK